MSTRKMLLVVDPQIDFITGSLPVPGAAQAMDKLAWYLAHRPKEYACKVVTADWHPADHSSFAPYGGQWPVHCVQYSVGAAIYPALYATLLDMPGGVHVLTKGTHQHKEEYSIFQDPEGRDFIIDAVTAQGIEQIDICGIAGDVCVLNTLADGVRLLGPAIWHVLTQFSPSLDGGSLLNQKINQLQLSCDL